MRSDSARSSRRKFLGYSAGAVLATSLPEFSLASSSESRLSFNTPAAAKPQRIILDTDPGVDDAMAIYLSTVAATRAHKTWSAYNLILNEFRKTCTKQHLDQIDKSDLTAFVVEQKKAERDDRTVANRLASALHGGVLASVATTSSGPATTRHIPR